MLLEALLMKARGFSTGSGIITGMDVGQFRLFDPNDGTSFNHHDLLPAGRGVYGLKYTPDEMLVRTRKVALHTSHGIEYVDVPVRTITHVTADGKTYVFEISGDVKMNKGMSEADTNFDVFGNPVLIGFTEQPVVGAEATYGLLKGAHCRAHSMFVKTLARGDMDMGRKNFLSRLYEDPATTIGGALRHTAVAPATAVRSLVRALGQNVKLDSIFKKKEVYIDDWDGGL